MKVQYTPDTHPTHHCTQNKQTIFLLNELTVGVVCRVHHQPLQWCSDGPVLGSLWSYLPRLPCLPHTALLLGAIPLHIPKQQWKPLSILQQVTVSWRHSFLSQTMHHTNNMKNITQPQGKVEAESIFLWTTSQTISDDNLISVTVKKINESCP